MENISQTSLVTRSGKKYFKAEESKKRAPTFEIEFPKPKQRNLNQTSERNKLATVQFEAFATEPATKKPTKSEKILTGIKSKIPAGELETTATKEDIDDENYDSFTDSIDLQNWGQSGT